LAPVHPPPDAPVVAGTFACGIQALNGSFVSGNRVSDVEFGIQCGTSGNATSLRNHLVINASGFDYDFAGL
jgi:hypothetical protein